MSSFRYGQEETQDHEPKRPVAVRMESLEATVAALGRRQARSLWWLAIAGVGGACLGAIGVLVAHGQAPVVVTTVREVPAGPADFPKLGKVIEAERLVIKDRSGAVRAVIGVDENNSKKPVGLELWGEGKQIARLGGHGPNAIGLVFPGETPQNGNGRAWIGVAAKEGTIGMADERDRITMRLDDSKTGPALKMLGKDGAIGLSLELTGGYPFLDVMDGRFHKTERILDEGVLVARPKGQ